ncbi:hypothetical protein BC629DRAFT_1539415 [Irpex lacteus]|nr:hypothetical protein BC629DRAFT_1539415 [Irpex lacteus]
MKSRLAEATEEVKKLKRYNLSRKQKEENLRKDIARLQEELQEARQQLAAHSGQPVRVRQRSPSPELVIVSDDDLSHVFETSIHDDVSPKPSSSNPRNPPPPVPATSSSPTPSMAIRRLPVLPPDPVKFGTDWSFQQKPPAKRKRLGVNDSKGKGLPWKVTSDGRPAVPLQLGPRVKLNKRN